MKKLTYKVFQKRNDILKYIQLALHHHLYVDGWVAQQHFRDELNNNVSITYMSICFEEGIPVGWACTVKRFSCRGNYEEVWAFVIPIYRRQGIATELVKMIGGIKDREFCAEIESQIGFWNSITNVA